MTTQLRANGGATSPPIGAVNSPIPVGSSSEDDGGKNALREHPKQVLAMGVVRMNDVIEQRSIVDDEMHNLSQEKRCSSLTPLMSIGTNPIR